MKLGLMVFFLVVSFGVGAHLGAEAASKSKSKKACPRELLDMSPTDSEPQTLGVDETSGSRHDSGRSSWVDPVTDPASNPGFFYDETNSSSDTAY